MSKNRSGIVIVGGGVAGLEALIALHTLLGDRVDLTLVSHDEWFVDRPVTVTEPFGLGSAARYSLPEIATEFGAEFVSQPSRPWPPKSARSAAPTGRSSRSTP